MIKIKTVLNTVLSILVLPMVFMGCVYAEDSTCESGKNGISISPVSQPFSISAGEEVFSEFTIKNISDNISSFTIMAAPYVMTNEEYTAPNFSDVEENYTQYTQIARWIKFENADGNFTESLNVDVDGCAEKNIKYKIIVPNSIPNGGQYAAILVRSNDSSDGNGSIKTVPQVGLLISARAVGETVRGAEIRDVSIAKTYTNSDDKRDVLNKINAYGWVENTGNVDLEVKTQFVIKNVFDNILYENELSAAVLPETTRKMNDIWENTPLFGLFWVSYTVSSNGESVNNTKLLFIMPFWMIVLMLVLIVIIVIWATTVIKKRRVRKARMLA